MTFFRESVSGLRIGLNITAPKTAELSEAQKIEALQNVKSVRILIVSEVHPEQVLVDEIVPACVFSSGNVGYKLHLSNMVFSSCKS